MIELPESVHHAEVVDAFDLTPGMRRVVFGGDGLAGYASTGVGDEYIRLIFPVEPSDLPELPALVDGNLDYSPTDLDRMRTYTVRDWDPAAKRLTVDFVVHEGGVAAAWARQARPGQVVVVNMPTGMYDPPAGLDWQILIADAAGLPAALRIVELTPTVATRLVLEVPDADHRVPTPERPGLDVTWIHGGNGGGASRLEEVARTLPRPDGVGYVWVAGESKVLRGVRRHLRHELKLPASAYKSVGYWIQEAERWHERYEALDEDTRSALDEIWSDDGDLEEQEDEYDRRLAELGL